MGLYACNIQKEEQIGILSLFLSSFLIPYKPCPWQFFVFLATSARTWIVASYSFLGTDRVLLQLRVPRLGMIVSAQSLFSPCGNGSYPRASPGRPVVRRYVDGLFPRQSLGLLAGLRPLDGLAWLALLLGRLPHVPGSVHASRWRLSYGSCCLPLS